MSRYVVERVLQSLVTLFGVTVVIFLLARISGDPILLMVPPEATLEEVEQVRQSRGLDKSWPEQYVIFIQGVMRGDFGESLRFGDPALEIVLERLPATLRLAGAGMAISLTLGLVVGTLSGLSQGSYIDRFGKLLAMLGQSVPVFWLGIMLILIFGVQLQLFPTSGYGGWKYLVLPAVTLGWYSTAALIRITRSSVLDVLDSDYIRLARIKGLHPWTIVTRHVLRNAAIPILTLASLQFISMLNGAVVTETIFAWPGLGRLMIDSVFARDFPVVQTAVFVAAVLFVATNLVVDLVYGLVDPRISYS